MSELINDRDALLLAAPTRHLPALDRELLLETSSPAGFKVSADGTTASPASITFTALQLGMAGTVAFTPSTGLTVTVSGNTATLTFANMSVDSGTVSASTTVDGMSYSRTLTVSKVRDGANGAPGMNTAQVLIYQRSASATSPDLPTAATTFTFATRALTGLNNGWSSTMPPTDAAKPYLHVSAASAASTATTDSIAANEWAGATILARDGGNGTPGLNVATVRLYKRTASAAAPAAPTSSLGSYTTYTFSTGAVAGITNGWSVGMPPLTEGAFLHTIHATAAATTSTDNISNTEWSAPQLAYDAQAIIDAQADADAAKARTDAMSANGVLDRAEKIDLIREWAEEDKIWAQVRTQASNLGVPYAAYDSAHTATSEYLLTLDPDWNDILTDTNIDRSVFNAKFNTMYEERVALQNAISAKAATAPLLTIGGRNLYLKTSEFTAAGIPATSQLVARLPTGFQLYGVVENTGVMRLMNVIKKNGTYTVSFDLHVGLANGYPMDVDICDSAVQTINPTTTPQHFELTFTVTNWSEGTYHFVDFGRLSAQHYFFDDFKLEEGTKATAYTSAPEDVTAHAEEYALAKANLAEVQAKAYADGIVTAEEERAIADASNKAEAARLNAVTVKDYGTGTTVFGQRERNDPPMDYPVGISRQFKDANALGVPGAGVGTWCTLETTIQYADASGGGGYQYVLLGIKTWRRYTNARTDSYWTGGWVQDLDRNAYTGDLDASRDITLIGRGVTLNGNTATKTGGSASTWDADVYSKDSYTGGAFASVVAAQTNGYIMFGLNSDPVTDAGYGSIDYALYLVGDGSCNILPYISGNSPGAVGTYATGDVLAVTYDGAYVRWLKNGAVLYSVPAAILTPLYFDSSFHTMNTSLSNIRFGPMSSSVDVPFIAAATASIHGNNIGKTSGNSGSWDSNVYSKSGFIGGAHARATVVSTNKEMMFGLNTIGDLTGPSYDTLNYAFYLMSSGNLRAYESNVSIDLGVTYAVGDVLDIVYDGSNVRYMRNGSVLRTVPVTINEALYFDSAFLEVGASLKGVHFGPLSSNNWNSVGGTGKPADNATVGADWNGNLANRPAESALLNGFISLSADGQLSGAGGGKVTLDGMGHKTYRVVSYGNGSTSTPATPGVYVNGVLGYGTQRSYGLVVIRRSDGNVDYYQTYDVYGNGEVTAGRNALTLAGDLNYFGSDKIVVVFCADEPKQRRLEGGLPEAMYRCGASRAVFGSVNFKSHSAYVLVGIPGCGEGNGAEAYQGAVDTDPNAWCDIGFNVVKGMLTGVSTSFTPKSLTDYGYMGDLNATSGITLVGRGVEVRGNFLKKTQQTSGWDADAYSKESAPYAYASATVTDLATAVFFGLNNDPELTAFWDGIFLSFYLEGGGGAYTGVNESLTNRFTVQVGDVLLITYDGVNARWFKNGGLLRTSPYDVGGIPLYFDSSFASIGGTLGSCQFGPIPSALWAHQGGAGKPQDNATVGAPIGTNVGNTPAGTIEQRANSALQGGTKPVVEVGANVNSSGATGTRTVVGSRTATVTNGTGTITYEWSISIYDNPYDGNIWMTTLPSDPTITIKAMCSVNGGYILGMATCKVTDANGLSSSDNFTLNIYF